MSLFAGRVALVTGGSSGIGRAIALALSRQGARVCIVGRNPAAVAETIAAAGESSQMTGFQVDLTVDGSLHPLLRHLREDVGKLDILVHCAGIFQQNRMGCAAIEDLDKQYAINVRAPYLLTQELLPLLTCARGQVVFINSSLGLAAKRPEIGQYAATKHALRGIADSLREEVNPKGVRVLTLYLGRTATPIQEALFQKEGRPYQPEMLIQPEDIASLLLSALTLPATAEVTDISIRPGNKLSL
jgi:NAD(P)-dependent dehydrogenase (short-subunit alcohol dehydrogenase family)